jgi:hypothetical protein
MSWAKSSRQAKFGSLRQEFGHETEMQQPWKQHSFLAVWKELPHQLYAEVATSRIGPTIHQPNL